MRIIETGARFPWEPSSFPPAFEATSLGDVKNFTGSAVEAILEARKQALGRMPAALRMFYPNTQSGNIYTCYFEVPSVNHRPGLSNTRDEEAILLRDSRLNGLEVGPSTPTERLLSPFPVDGIAFRWDKARREPWNADVVGLQAAYSEINGLTEARYTLVYLLNDDLLFLKLPSPGIHFPGQSPQLHIGHRA